MILLDSELSILDWFRSRYWCFKIISNGINNFMSPDKSIILITHYQRLLDYVNPDYVHVQDGKIIKTGSAN
jgi:Fe-S cluster assembly ATP-binding protein